MREKETGADNAEEMSRLAYEMQALRGRLEEFQRQAAAIQSLAENAEATAEAVSKMGREAVFQLGAGAMVKARPSETIIVDIGAGIMAEKNPADAQKILGERARQAGAALQRIQAGISEVAARMNEVNQKAEKLRRMD